MIRQIADRLAERGMGGDWRVSGGALRLEIIAGLLFRPLLAVGLAWYDSVAACAAE